jgi:hypothetical protein
MKEMKLTVVEDFLKNNVDFELYISNSENENFTKVLTVNGDTDFENLEHGYVIESKDDFITWVEVEKQDLNIYKLVKENDCN